MLLDVNQNWGKVCYICSSRCDFSYIELDKLSTLQAHTDSTLILFIYNKKIFASERHLLEEKIN